MAGVALGQAWKSWLDDGSERACAALALATGHDCERSWPELPGEPEFAISHAASTAPLSACRPSRAGNRASRARRSRPRSI
jgi:hypothetical protein